MMFQQVAAMRLALVAIQLGCLAMHQADAFPALFSRGSLFRRTNAQQQAQQQQPNPGDQLVPLANSAAPITFQQQQAAHFGQLHPAELMRLSGAHQQIGAHPLHQLAQQQQQVAASLSIPFSGLGEPIQLVDSSAQAAAYYKPNVVSALPPPQQQLVNNEMQQQHESEQMALQPTFDLYDNSASADSAETQPLKPQASRAVHQKARQQMQLEPTHTSEVVDKIEQHIDKQIERGMAEHEVHLEGRPVARQAAASGYHHHHQQAHKMAEKEAAASGEGEESSGEGGESGHAEEKSEKHHEPEVKVHKEEEHHHHHHDHHHHDQHHHEGAPEAFEIHHKKGGKSFQYFHQGHSH